MQQFKLRQILFGSGFLLRNEPHRRKSSIRPLTAHRKSSPKSVKLKESFDVYAISDLHTDSEDNLEWVRSLSKEAYRNDVLIVAGDISHKKKIIRVTLQMLLRRFCHVAFVPGNHELWAKDVISAKGFPPQLDSMGKLEEVMKLCNKLGVITQPTRLRNLWLIPILSWHHKSFDQEPDGPNFKELMPHHVSDYRLCDWSSLDESLRTHGADELASHFDGLNSDLKIQSKECDIITFSHFVPSQDLIPEKRYLRIPYLAKVAGSNYLNERIKALNSNIHVFGHTHIAWDITLDGIRFIQCPLGQSRERKARPRSMLSATTNSDPRLQLTLSKETEEWNGEAAEWLPVKIYTHHSRETTGGNLVDHSDSGQAVEDDKSVKELKSGKMCESFAFWSEHYKRTKRTPQIVDRDNDDAP